ncbi:MAG: MBL fold metallo-hydrolase [Pirellulales bacterium]
MLNVAFHGAAETVTGSKYLLETDDARVLIDCGLFQGLKELRERNWHNLPFPPQTVQAVVLTHAHIDHIGYLPRFVKTGFRGPIYCTPATEELAEILLYDSAGNQENDAEYANRKGFSKHQPALPLYDATDVGHTVKRLQGVARDKWFNPAGSIWCRFHNAGHLLGSAMIEVEVRKPERTLRVLFSGDVGRYGDTLYHDPVPPPECDYLICESTYGDRDHGPQKILDQLADVVNDAVNRGGVMVTASFAVGRAQQLIFLLRVLEKAGRIPRLPIYLDSPMAANATLVFNKYADEHDMTEDKSISPEEALKASNVHIMRTVDESRRINSVAGPAVIIASNGMMTGGRILHHLKQRLPDPRNTVVIGGYMAPGTRGRDMQDGRSYIRIHGQDVPVRAHRASISAISGHAGRSELLKWLAKLPAPRRTFLTHGELSSANALAETLRTERQWDVVVPKHGSEFPLT